MRKEKNSDILHNTLIQKASEIYDLKFELRTKKIESDELKTKISILKEIINALKDSKTKKKLEEILKNKFLRSLKDQPLWYQALIEIFDLYLKRPDLQKEFSEVKNGDFSSLLGWAITFGVKEEKNLTPFSDIYKELSKSGSLKLLQAQFENKNKELSNLQNKHDNQTSTLSNLQNKYDNQTSTLSNLQNKHDNQTSTLSNLQNKHDNQTSTLSNLQNKHDNQTSTLSNLQNKYDNQTSSLSNLQNKYDSQKTHLAQLEKKFNIQLNSSKMEPIYILLSTYIQRDDLQKQFPEVKDGNIDNLLQWAFHVVTGGVEDTGYDFLLPHTPWITKKIYEPKPRFFKENSLQYKIKKIVSKCIQIQREEGVRKLSSHIATKIKRNEFKLSENNVSISNVLESIKKNPVNIESQLLSQKQNLTYDHENPEQKLLKKIQVDDSRYKKMILI